MAHMKKVIKKNRTSSEGNNQNKSNDIVVTLIICVLMLAIAYGVSSLIYHLNKKPITINETDQYIINASEIFDMSSEEYYVMVYDKKGEDALSLGVIVNNYRKTDKKKLYVVDLSKEYNKSIIGDTSNMLATTTSELSIANSTLLKIKDHKIAGYYENLLLIEKELK